jgi:hypothetical protein
MPRYLLIDRASPVSDQGTLRLSHLVWRGLLPLGTLGAVTVGTRPAPAWRRPHRRLGDKFVAARPGVSDVPDLGSADRRARLSRRLAAWEPSLAIFADPGLFAAFAGIGLGAARRVLLVDRLSGDPALLASAADRADAVWALGGPVAESLSAGRRKGGKRIAAKLAAIPAAVDSCSPGPLPAGLSIGLPIDDPDEAPSFHAAAARLADRLGAAGLAVRIKPAGGAPDFDLKRDVAALESASFVYVPAAQPRFRPLMMGAVAAGRPAIGTDAAFAGLALGAGEQVLVGADERAFVDAAASLLRNPALAASIGDAAREAVDRHHGVDAALHAVGAAVRHLGFETVASIEAVAANLKPETRDIINFFNPVTRLFSVNGMVRAAVPNTAVSAAFEAGDEVSELVNAFVQVTPKEDDWSYVSADAVLPAEVSPEHLTVRIEAFGIPVLVLTPDATPTPELGGLIALESAGPGLVSIEAWAIDPETRIRAGRAICESAVVLPPRLPSAQAPHPGRFAFRVAARLRAAAPLPADRKKIDVIPGSGRGQTFDGVERWLAAETTSSAMLSRWQNRHAGETAWLIGNGPSVRVEDLDRLGSAITFAFNRFHLSHDMTRLRPTYTVSGDKQMIEDFGQDIVDRSGGTVFLAHDRVPDLVGDYVWLRQLSVAPPLFSLNPDRAVAPGGSSLFVALQLGYFMGIRRFYVYGADFRFTFRTHKRSRDAYRAVSGDDNHFIRNYREGRAWCPPSFRQIASSFFAARVLMESENGFIRNATRGGALEIFPRLDFDEALAAS